jgi:hypothetical protein
VIPYGAPERVDTAEFPALEQGTRPLHGAPSVIWMWLSLQQGDIPSGKECNHQQQKDSAISTSSQHSLKPLQRTNAWALERFWGPQGAGGTAQGEQIDQLIQGLEGARNEGLLCLHTNPFIFPERGFPTNLLQNHSILLSNSYSCFMTQPMCPPQSSCQLPELLGSRPALCVF